MDLGAATHPGLVRPGNEDGFYASRKLGVFAVADGMGGHEHGELASQITLKAIEADAEKLAAASPIELPTLLHETLQAANNEIILQAQSTDAQHRMGTTVVLASICGDRLYFAHIGDSRLYLLRGDAFSQLTRDHSLVQSLVDKGEITPDEAAIHPLRHQITRVVGGDDQVAPEIASQALEPGDRILLCTDGLSGAVDQELIKLIMSKRISSQHKADALVKAALAAGGPDNITAVVIGYQHPRPLAPAKANPAKQAHTLSRLQSGIITMMVLLIACAAYAYLAHQNPRYNIQSDNGTPPYLAMYKSWPLLPFLPKEKMLVENGLNEILFEDARDSANLKKAKSGMAEKEIGDSLLQKIAEDTSSKLAQDTKKSLNIGDVSAARSTLNRMHAINVAVNKDRVIELEQEVSQQEATKAIPNK